MKVLICGDREWKDKEKIKAFLFLNGGISAVIEGECRGADTLAKEAAEEMSISVETFPADWKRYGKGAGMIRNEQMIVEGKPDLVVAFHSNIEKSKGTKSMLELAKKYNIPSILIT